MQNNLIKIKDNKLILSFRFDPHIITAVRSIDGRKWNAGDKQWEVPIENIEQVLDVLKPFDFVADPHVKNILREQESFFKKIDEIRASEEKYNGDLPLYGFQHTGANFLKAMPAALLADVPGLGKSIQTIAATENDDHILIFCPASLKYNWQEEILKWKPNSKVIVIDGNKEMRTTQWHYALTVKYVIANYELLIHDFDIIKEKKWGTVVCDEATRVSNPDAQSVKNLKALSSQKRLALTGTPVSNSPLDIFGIFNWLLPGYLGALSQFKAKYCNQEEDWGRGRTYSRITGYKNIDILRDKVGRFMLRRTKEEVFTDFPPKTVEHIVFSLPESERRMYRSIKEQVIDEIKKLSDLDTRTLGIIPVKMLRLKQCTGHTKLVGGYGNGESTKLETLKTLLKPIIDSGEKAIIFTQFAEMLHIMKNELQEFDPLVIYGDVDSQERMIRVKEFNDDPNPRIIIMTEAGAYGLNMQSATYVVHYDAPWSVAKLTQREDRAHRHGQTKPVTVYHLIAKDTIDEYVLKTLHKKQKISSDILADIEQIGKPELGQEDIDEILKL